MRDDEKPWVVYVALEKHYASLELDDYQAKAASAGSSVITQQLIRCETKELAEEVQEKMRKLHADFTGGLSIEILQVGVVEHQEPDAVVDAN